MKLQAEVRSGLSEEPRPQPGDLRRPISIGIAQRVTLLDGTPKLLFAQLAVAGGPNLDCPAIARVD